MKNVAKNHFLTLVAVIGFIFTSSKTHAIPLYYTFEFETTHSSGEDWGNNAYTRNPFKDPLVYPLLTNGLALGPGARVEFTFLLDFEKSAGSVSHSGLFYEYDSDAIYAEFIGSQLPAVSPLSSTDEYNYASVGSNPISLLHSSLDPTQPAQKEIQVGNDNSFISLIHYGTNSWGINYQALTNTGLNRFRGSFGSASYDYTNPYSTYEAPELSATSAPIAITLLGGLLAFGLERRRKYTKG